ncbi:P-loop containing nucleoside triphosphate hydrolase protein [Polychytrium aggregatum]|uniref:P-loop containing nucleoside triphosphate hydrolase protein n=1 Tax=Polychytrium aggregatum TaxID=110093 RepID=UPI0022FE7C7C|nr:P-loop containing nucleoside triphosphate hydrolase protein [Polychytrium aggregatum]KAI9208362.1 P-loop containing nucleoside triphosphate hydrolase protein [Polychytrium aggregatum]
MSPSVAYLAPQPFKESDVSLYSRLSFSWANDLISLANIRQLQPLDVWDLDSSDKTATLIARFRLMSTKTESTTSRLFLTIWKPLGLQIALTLMAVILTFTNPFFLNLLLRWLQCPHQDNREAWMYLFVWFGFGVIKRICDTQLFFSSRRTGTRIKTILMHLIYQKSLRRPLSSRPAEKDGAPKDASLGKIVTIMSNDTEAVREVVCYLYIVAELPLKIAISAYALVLLVGSMSAFVGLSTLLICIPLSSWIGRRMNKSQQRLSSFTDSRVNKTNEMLQIIRIIKYFAWESYFVEKINRIREDELRCRFRLWLNYMALGTLTQSTGLICAFGIFATFSLLGNTLDAATAFTTLTVCQQLTSDLSAVPWQVMRFTKGAVALDRIYGFLGETEIDEQAEPVSLGPDNKSFRASKQASFVHYGGRDDSVANRDNGEGDRSSLQFVLRGLTLELPIGKLTAVCGATGAGKTSLVLSILGEMKIIAGEASSVHRVDQLGRGFDRVAYASQTAWLMNASIRDNILCGEEYDERRYIQVLEACSLVKDLQNFEEGDATEIGERGINLSGGQKQRVALARACYSTASLVILDDPLSAVDAPTARHLVHFAICGLLQGRTCILTTHAIGLVVPQADHLIVVSLGEIHSQGPPQQVLASAEARLLLGVEGEDIKDEGADIEPKLPVDTESVLRSKPIRQLIQEEKRVVGAVSKAVYHSYYKAVGGLPFLLLALTLMLLAIGTGFLNSWWLKHWTDSSVPSSQIEGLCSAVSNTSVMAAFPLKIQTDVSVEIDSAITSSDTAAINSVYYFLGIYALLGSSVILVEYLNLLLELVGSVQASKRLHTQLLESVLGAPLRFFDTTPLGRVLNRFAKEMADADNDVMEAIHKFCNWMFKGLSILVILSSIAPSFLLMVIPIACVYVYMAQRYLICSRDLKRLESTSRSPIFSQFAETLDGIATIRAYRLEDRLVTNIWEMFDQNSRCYFYFRTLSRWLSLRSDIISALFVFCTGAVILMDKISTGWAGLGLTYAIAFTDTLLWTIRYHAEMEREITSIERIDEYANIEQEESRDQTAYVVPDASWPSRGEIVAENLSVKYSNELPEVLHSLSFDIRPGEKIGVVGQTGAGKSTLTLAFFRIIPMSQGRIIIDGVDVSKIRLCDLRSHMTIIPQDPVLFAGTLRANLDPLQQHDDAGIWMALKRVHFANTLGVARSTDSVYSTETLLIEESDDSAPAEPLGLANLSLDTHVAENGSNFSQGQRQLLCLARALLRTPKILFLDEATASVDNQMDSQIQTTIREEFKDTTLVCIAHRLRSVIDYDRILVLDKGAIVEFDTPWNLINRESGVFRRMCENSSEFSELRRIAGENQAMC